MNDTNYIMCFFFCVRDSGVGRQSGWNVQWTDYTTPQLEGCMQPSILQRLIFYIFLMYIPEENGSSYCLHHPLTFSTKTYKLTFPVPPISSSSPLVACPETN